MYYPIINDNDANEQFIVEANSSEEASHKALRELGWFVSQPLSQEDIEDIED